MIVAVTRTRIATWTARVSASAHPASATVCFVQAEDGIRDHCVTGVQTCALPILLREHHPGITPVVLSMSSAEIESGLEDLSLDLALGYSARMPPRGPRLQSWPQYEEHYYLLCRECREYRDGQGEGRPFAFGADIAWREVAAMPLCLLTPDMHNRTVIDEAFAAVDMAVQPAMETNSVLTLVMAVAQGTDGMTTVLPGAMVATVRHMTGLVARSEEHTSELQSHSDLVCRHLLEKNTTAERPETHVPRSHDVQ